MYMWIILICVGVNGNWIKGNCTVIDSCVAILVIGNSNYENICIDFDNGSNELGELWSVKINTLDNCTTTIDNGIEGKEKGGYQHKMTKESPDSNFKKSKLHLEEYKIEGSYPCWHDNYKCKATWTWTSAGQILSVNCIYMTMILSCFLLTLLKANFR